MPGGAEFKCKCCGRTQRFVSHALAYRNDTGDFRLLKHAGEDEELRSIGVWPHWARVFERIYAFFQWGCSACGHVTDHHERLRRTCILTRNQWICLFVAGVMFAHVVIQLRHAPRWRTNIFTQVSLSELFVAVVLWYLLLTILRAVEKRLVPKEPQPDPLTCPPDCGNCGEPTTRLATDFDATQPPLCCPVCKQRQLERQFVWAS